MFATQSSPVPGTAPARPGLRHRIPLALALAATTVAAAGSGTAAAATPVPCSKASAMRFTCNFSPALSPVKSSDDKFVGSLRRGRHFVFCQSQGRRVTAGGRYNSNWARTLADNGKPGWVNAAYATGGANDGLFRGVPKCDSAAGAPPQAAPVAPPAAPGSAAKVITWATDHVSWWARMYSQSHRLPTNLSVAQMQTQAPPRGNGQGCDCSSFVRWAMAQGGVLAGTFTGDIWTAMGLLPHTTASAHGVSAVNGVVDRGYGVVPPGGYRAGDLVFYGVSGLDRPSGKGHVAIYSGGGKIVQCSGTLGSNAGAPIGQPTGWVRYARVA